MRLTFLGDIMLDAEQLAVYRKGKIFDFEGAINSIEEEFSDSSYIIGNLETPIAGEELLYTHEKYCFNSPKSFAEYVKACGIDMVTTANNHCLDRGIEGIRNTIKNLDECGLEHIGTHVNREDSFVIKEIDGIKVGFLAFTYGTNAFSNNIYLQKDEKYMVDLLQNQELENKIVRYLWRKHNFLTWICRGILKRIGMCQFNVPIYERREKAKKQLDYYKNTIKKCKKAGAEYIIACLHIGGQYNDKPTEYTKNICQLSMEYGVNAVIANHEHVIHGVTSREEIDSPFCIYSLGNFLSNTGVTCDPFGKMTEYSVVLHIDLNRNQMNKLCAKYSFSIFCNVLDRNGKVKSVPLYKYIEQCDDNKRRKLLKENNILVNRVYGTTDNDYPIKKEYLL